MPARERELGELPSPIWSLLDRKVGQGLDAYRLACPLEPMTKVSCPAGTSPPAPDLTIIVGIV
jgi:hypothetical protein